MNNGQLTTDNMASPLGTALALSVAEGTLRSQRHLYSEELKIIVY